MRVISISGTRGSGKTTLVKALAQRFSHAGKKICVINNEEGKVLYDEAFTTAFNIEVRHLRGG